MINQQIPHATTVSALRARIKSWRDEGLTIGFVPTMGALHDGHVSLVRIAKAQCDRVVTSIFVNPEQFAPGEDFETYPRSVMDDAERLTAVRCDLIYLPEREIMYPPGFATRLHPAGAALGLEAEMRPHFFGGVATVVAKLLNQVTPDVAVFGEKDYQQLLVIRQMVRDLDMPVDIIGGETQRERDGLAMSSRNAYLSAEEREKAGRLNVILRELGSAIASGDAVTSALEAARKTAGETYDSVDYIDVRCARTLAPHAETDPGNALRVLGAVRLGSTRLIDNCAVPPS